MRPCHSETNLDFLREEVQTKQSLSSPVSQSQENLTEEKKSRRQCYVSDNSVYIRNSVPCLHPQGKRHEDNDGEVEEEMDNPFQEEEEEEKDMWRSSSKERQPTEHAGSEGIEMRRVEEGVKGYHHTTVTNPIIISSSPAGSPKLDYNFRRMRSSTALPHSASSTFYIDVPPDYQYRVGERLRQPTVQASLATSYSPKLSRRKPRSESAGVVETSKSSWVTRYQPGVLLLRGGTMRECLIQRMLHEKEEQFCVWKRLRWEEREEGW